MTYMQSILLGLFFGITVLLFPHKIIDKRLQPSVDWALRIIKEECPEKNYSWPLKIEINMVDRLDVSYVGVCKRAPGIFIIEIQEYYYNQIDEELLHTLVAHELVHCLFHQDHINEPYNLMNPTLQVYLTPSLEDQLRSFAKKSCQKN
jgi:hypothetical protein